VKKNNWIYSFDGLSFNKLAEDKWNVKKDGGVFDEFSGATITPRAVVKAVKEGVSLFVRHRDEFLEFDKADTDRENITKKKINILQNKKTYHINTTSTEKDKVHEK
jgi:hypothetical protein